MNSHMRFLQPTPITLFPICQQLFTAQIESDAPSSQASLEVSLELRMRDILLVCLVYNYGPIYFSRPGVCFLMNPLSMVAQNCRGGLSFSSKQYYCRELIKYIIKILKNPIKLIKLHSYFLQNCLNLFNIEWFLIFIQYFFEKIFSKRVSANLSLKYYILDYIKIVL